MQVLVELNRSALEERRSREGVSPKALELYILAPKKNAFKYNRLIFAEIPVVVVADIPKLVGY